jgi:hypothetical protein
VKTSSGAPAVQIAYSWCRGSRQLEHIGSAHDEAELELLKDVARQKLAGGQSELDLGLQAPPEQGGPLPITGSRMGHLWDGLCAAYDVLGFDVAAGGDRAQRAGWLEDALNNAVAIHTERFEGIGDVADFSAEIA